MAGIYRQIIGLSMLVITSAGPLPLWLHHQLVHSGCLSNGSMVCDHSLTADAHGATDHHRHSHVACDSRADDDLAISPVDGDNGFIQSPQMSDEQHDCSMCYQLSQVSSPGMICVAVVAVPVVESPRADAGLHTITSLRTPYRPRGPPAV